MGLKIKELKMYIADGARRLTWSFSKFYLHPTCFNVLLWACRDALSLVGKETQGPLPRLHHKKEPEHPFLSWDSAASGGSVSLGKPSILNMFWAACPILSSSSRIRRHLSHWGCQYQEATGKINSVPPPVWYRPCTFQPYKQWITGANDQGSWPIPNFSWR